jgi:uncharacterized protein YndB with AHSA1/START domain
MPAKIHDIKIKQVVAAPILEVYNAFINPSSLSEWFCNVAQVDAYKGGRLYFWWDSGYYASGEFINLIPGDRLVFSWHGRGEPGVSRVKVTFRPVDEVTRICLYHMDIGSGSAWKHARRVIKRGWTLGLENLKSVLETGQDLRYSHRPMLGFTSIQGMEADEAAQAGLPARPGLLILGVTAGMCLEQAGLRGGDYLIKAAGQKTTTLVELNDILNQHRAGAKIKLVFYRDGEKISAKATLSQRPMPEIPDDPEGLSIALSKMYDRVNIELDETFKGVRSDQIDSRSSATTWSIRETMGHLIATEREMHGWITRMIEGQEADFSLRSNQPVRVRATISAFPNLESLMAELKRNQSETIAMAADLPAEFLNRKRRYWRLALELLQTPPLHYEEHLGMMRLILEKEYPEETGQSTEEDQDGKDARSEITHIDPLSAG